MKRLFVFRIVMAVVLVVVFFAGVSFAFRTGVEKGLVMTAQTGEGSTRLAPWIGPGYPMMGGYHFGLFNPFGFLIGLFLLFIFFGVLRRMLWGGMHRGHAMHAGRWMEKDVPPFFTQWHNRSHEQAGANHAEESPAEK